MKKKQLSVASDHLRAIITLLARKANQYDYDGVTLQDDWEEMSVVDLLDFIKETCEGEEFILRAVK
jgi:hypothetical protein